MESELKEPDIEAYNEYEYHVNNKPTTNAYKFDEFDEFDEFNGDSIQVENIEDESKKKSYTVKSNETLISYEKTFIEQENETLFYFSLSSKEELDLVDDDTTLMFIIINPKSVNTDDDNTFIKNMLDGCIFINKIYKDEIINFIQEKNSLFEKLTYDQQSTEKKSYLEKLKTIISNSSTENHLYDIEKIYEYFKDILIIEKNSNSQKLIEHLKEKYLLKYTKEEKEKEEKEKEENSFFEFPDSFDILNDGVISNNVDFSYIFNNSIFVNTNKYNGEKIKNDLKKLCDEHPQCRKILDQFIHIKETANHDKLSVAIRDIFNRKSVFFWFYLVFSGFIRFSLGWTA
jgi:hypothetical protein